VLVIFGLVSNINQANLFFSIKLEEHYILLSTRLSH
jgi:hypothetical protein